MESSRELTKDEEQLIAFLISKSSVDIPVNWRENLLAKPLDDGGMGSLFLFYKGTHVDKKRKLGLRVSEMTFVDEDGVDIIVSLNVDEKEILYELDVWKVDYSKRISRFPINNME